MCKEVNGVEGLIGVRPHPLAFQPLRFLRTTDEEVGISTRTCVIYSVIIFSVLFWEEKPEVKRPRNHTKHYQMDKQKNLVCVRERTS